MRQNSLQHNTEWCFGFRSPILMEEYYSDVKSIDKTKREGIHM